MTLCSYSPVFWQLLSKAQDMAIARCAISPCGWRVGGIDELLEELAGFGALAFEIELDSLPVELVSGTTAAELRRQDR
jgi:hypothetical protein